MTEKPSADQTIEISIESVRTAIDIALKQLVENVGPTVEIGTDLFWSIPLDVKFDYHTKPSEITLGSIADVINHLDQLESSPADVIPYHLQWISELLSAFANLGIKPNQS